MSEQTPADFDGIDVPAALQRVTQDGAGFEHEDELPPETFESFATEGVEAESQ